jgi:chromosome segregation ATPase
MADITAQILTEIRDEAREARAETRENFKTVFHRFALVETGVSDANRRLTSVEHRLTSVERHMAALLDTVPVMNERIDRPEARVAALESRGS